MVSARLNIQNKEIQAIAVIYLYDECIVYEVFTFN